MADIQKISVSLTAEQLAAVKEAVESGAYASTSEVIRDALRGWQLREQVRQAEIARIRKAWEEGLASGPSKPYNIDEILAEGKRRLTEHLEQRKRA